MNLGKIFGIHVELHWSFLALIAGLIVALAVFSPNSLLGTVFLMVALFASVLMHEFTHSLVSQGLGYKVSKIVLLPIGGISLSQEMPKTPKHEFVIAVSGPLFNFLLVAILLLAVPAIALHFKNYAAQASAVNASCQANETECAKQLEGLNARAENKVNQLLVTDAWFALFYVNLILGLFNLLVPALPMDGGRVFRSLLAMAFGYEKATKWVTTLSMVIAGIMVVLGFVSGSIFLPIIGLFVYFGSQAEFQGFLVKKMLRHADLSKAIITKVDWIDGEQTLEQAVDWLKKKNRAFVLVKHGDQYGQLSINDLYRVKKSDWWEVQAFKTAIHLSPAAVKGREKPDEIYVEMVRHGWHYLPLKEKNRLVGFISLEGLQNLFELSKIDKGD